MTEADVIAHWRKRAAESLAVARLAHRDGHFAHALFNCHLAVEKALKAMYMEQRRSEPPPTHDLMQIAFRLDRDWTKDEKQLFADLTGYAVAARYDDPAWAEREATAENAAAWIRRVDVLLSSFLP